MSSSCSCSILTTDTVKLIPDGKTHVVDTTPHQSVLVRVLVPLTSSPIQGCGGHGYLSYGSPNRLRPFVPGDWVRSTAVRSSVCHSSVVFVGRSTITIVQSPNITLAILALPLAVSLLLWPVALPWFQIGRVNVQPSNESWSRISTYLVGVYPKQRGSSMLIESLRNK